MNGPAALSSGRLSYLSDYLSVCGWRVRDHLDWKVRVVAFVLFGFPAWFWCSDGCVGAKCRMAA